MESPLESQPQPGEERANDRSEMAETPPALPDVVLMPDQVSTQPRMSDHAPARARDQRHRAGAVLAALLLVVFPMGRLEAPGIARTIQWKVTPGGHPLAQPLAPTPKKPPVAVVVKPPEPLPQAWVEHALHPLVAPPLATRSEQAIASPSLDDLTPTTWTPPDPTEASAPVSIKFSTKLHRLEVYQGSMLTLAFHVGLGASGSTPQGTFSIEAKAVEPEYRAPDGRIVPGGTPQNPLGSRWMALQVAGRTGIGIHGTNRPDSIGTDQSRGCIRMRNEDVESLFLAIPAHTWVSIEPI